MEVPAGGGLDKVSVLAILINTNVLDHLDDHPNILGTAGDDDAEGSGFQDGQFELPTSKYGATPMVAVSMLP